MIRLPARWKGPLAASAAAAMALLALTTTASPAFAGTYATLSGSGSSWAAVALDRRHRASQSNGLTVNFNEDGSAAGRGDYMQGGRVDFAASDPPFRNGDDSSRTPARSYRSTATPTYPTWAAARRSCTT